MDNIFLQLKNIPKQGIYILQNSNNMSAYIGYSSNIPLAILKNIDYDYSNMEVLEIVTSKECLRPRCQYWKDKYSNGEHPIFKLINPGKVCNLKLKIELLEDFRELGTGKYLFYVNLVSRGYKKVTVGIFEDISSVELFVAQNYSNRVYDIVYAENDITQVYLRLVHGIYK